MMRWTAWSSRRAVRWWWRARSIGWAAVIPRWDWGWLNWLRGALYYNWPYNRPRWGVLTMAMQTDGSLLLGGHFSVVDDFSTREHIARISPNGFLDGGFNPGANGSVYALAVEADGRILLGGTFTVAGGQPRTNLARIHPNGTPDAAFRPTANGGVYALALQTDRKIVIGGDFTEVSGAARSHIARLNPDGTLDPTFDPGANGPIQALTIQPDGAILVGGSFTLLGGQPRTNLGRLLPMAPATQSLGYDGTNVTWLRGGSSPEVWHTLFSHSTNGVTWNDLGAGSRIEGGWQVANVSIPAHGVLRAQGQAAGSERGSEWFVETLIGDLLVTGNPSSRTNNAGTAATFSAAAVGPRPLGYRWLKDGIPLVDTGTISGAATLSLQLSNVLKADEGSYALLVTNLSGSVTSLTATLTVKDPVMVAHPTNLLRDLGQDALFNASAQGTPPLGYQWWKDGSLLSGQTNTALLVTNVQAARCRQLRRGRQQCAWQRHQFGGCAHGERSPPRCRLRPERVRRQRDGADPGPRTRRTNAGGRELRRAGRPTAQHAGALEYQRRSQCAV